MVINDIPDIIVTSKTVARDLCRLWDGNARLAVDLTGDIPAFEGQEVISMKARERLASTHLISSYLRVS